MNLTSAKIGLFIIAAIIIGAGIRSDNALLRWIGIGLLAVAFALRFYKKDVPE